MGCSIRCSFCRWSCCSWRDRVLLPSGEEEEGGAGDGEAEDLGGGAEVVAHLALVVVEAGFVEEGGVGFVVEQFGGASVGVDDQGVDDAADGGPVGGVGGFAGDERGGPGEGEFAADLEGMFRGGSRDEAAA